MGRPEAYIEPPLIVFGQGNSHETLAAFASSMRCEAPLAAALQDEVVYHVSLKTFNRQIGIGASRISTDSSRAG